MSVRRRLRLLRDWLEMLRHRDIVVFGDLLHIIVSQLGNNSQRAGNLRIGY